MKFCVQEVSAYPAYYNSDDGKYYYYKSINKHAIGNDQYNWLELTATTTQLLLDQFAGKGTQATHWYIEVTCYAENIPNISRYEYHPLGGGATTSVRGYNGTTTFNFAFPVQDTSARYYNGITGGLYYNAGSGETSFGLTGALALNSTFSGAI